MTGMFSRAAVSQSELRVGDLKTGAVCLLRVHPGFFEDLETDRAVLHVGLELDGRLLPVARPDVAESIEAVGKHGEAVGVRRALDVVDALLDGVAESAAQIVQHPDIQRIHLRDQCLDRLGRRTGVAVNVYDGKPGFRNRMLPGNQRGLRTIVDDRGRRELGSLARAHAHERGSWRALFSWLNRYAATSAATAALPRRRSLGKRQRRSQRGDGQHERST